MLVIFLATATVKSSSNPKNENPQVQGLFRALVAVDLQQVCLHDLQHMWWPKAVLAIPLIPRSS